MMTDETQTPTDQAQTDPQPQDQAAQAPDTPETDIPSAADSQPDQPDAPEVEAPAEPDQPTEPEVPQPATPEPEVPQPPTPEPEMPAPADPELPQPRGESDDQVEDAPVEAPAPPVTAAVETRVSRQDDMALFEAAMSAMEAGEDTSGHEGSYKKLSKGDRVEATVIQVDKDRVFVDLGTKSEGIVPLGELSEENLESAKGHVQVGDKITVVVLRPEGGEGNPIVSKKRADFEEAWDTIEKSFEDGRYITAQVVDRVKGGLVVDIGVRGFVPATHVGSGKLRNIEKFVGQPMQLKIIEIDRDRKKVVLSNRQAEEERRVRAKEEIFENVAPGEVLDGTVRRLTDYGAFVDLGGVDGLLHISEMSWARINHPKEMFKEGQKIKVMVLRLDAGAGKISLGHRQVLPDPWNLIKENYTVGQKLTCTISRIVQSGAFIRLPEGAEAFMPVSEMSVRRIRRPQDVVEEGQEVEAQVIDLRPDERRMVLSMRAVGGGAMDQGRGPGAPAQHGGGGYEDDMRGADKRGLAGKKGKKKGRGGRHEDEDIEEVVGRRGFATGGATIGERLGMLRGFLGRDEDEEEPEAETDAEAVVEAEGGTTEAEGATAEAEPDAVPAEEKDQPADE
jgi:predicted RNA-binding protein with RPS1 domain